MKNLAFIILIMSLLGSCATETQDQTAANNDEPAATENTQTAEAGEELPQVATIDTASICEVPHSRECREKIETYLLEHYNLGKREGKILTLNVEQGDDISLEDNEDPVPENYINYRLAAYYPAAGLYNVEKYYYEGGGNLIIDSQTGEQIAVDAFEGLSISPDNKRFVAYSISLETGYFPNQLTVCRHDNGKFIKEKEKEFTYQEGPSNVRWINNNEFKVDEVTLGQNMERIVVETHTFKLENNEWVQQ